MIRCLKLYGETSTSVHRALNADLGILRIQDRFGHCHSDADRVTACVLSAVEALKDMRLIFKAHTFAVVSNLQDRKQLCGLCTDFYRSVFCGMFGRVF